MKNYSIGAVAKLTGLTTHTIRKWEDRYEIICPLRSSGGSRRYSDEQVTKLRLLKSLVDAGQNISEIASFSAAALKELCANQLELGSTVTLDNIKTGVI